MTTNATNNDAVAANDTNSGKFHLQIRSIEINNFLISP